MVQDYWYLNDWTVKNNYPLPLILQLVDKLKGFKLFMKMDLWWGYNNMQICEGDEWKAVFTMHKGSFKPLIMYFSLCNSPATFQKMMNVTIPFLFLLRGCCAPGYTDVYFSFSFSFSYAHGRYALIGRFLVTWLWTLSYHVPPVCLLVFSLSCLRFLTYASYPFWLCRLVSCPGLRYAHMFAGRLVSRLVPVLLAPSLLPGVLSLVHLPDWMIFLSLTFTALRLFVLVSTLQVYITGWRWDDPHLQSTLQPP